MESEKKEEKPENPQEKEPEKTDKPSTEEKPKPSIEELKKKEKIKAPKRKYAIIHGYNGHDFSGNQKYSYFLNLIETRE